MVEAISSQLLNNASGVLGSAAIQAVSPLIPILQAVSIAVLVYVIFLIIKAIVGINSSLRLKRIAKNVEEINAKLDLIVRKDKKKK